MRTTRCMCGATFSGDSEELFVAMRAHIDEAHSEWGLTDTSIRNYLDAEQRLSDATDRLEDIGAVEVREATTDRLDDLLDFFDHRGFAGNPGWASCYCVFHHVGGRNAPEWGNRTWRENRDMLCERIRARTTTGLLAYVDGTPAAWCNASPRSAFPEYAGRDDHPDDEVGSIVCFVVAPPYRRHGLAAQLLDAACQMFRREDMQLAEAYPRKETRGDDASAYHGPLDLYLGAGFEQVAERDGVVVVQKRL